MSLIGGYTTRSVTFNITGMSDEEYNSNQIWLESELYNNYENVVKNRNGTLKHYTNVGIYYKDLIARYLKKIIKVKPVIKKLNGMFANPNFVFRKNTVEAEITEQNRVEYVDFMSLYPEMTPDIKEGDLGFKNAVLKDPRIDKIFNKAA